MTAPERPGPDVEYDYDPEDTCPNCAGDGFVEACFEDTCVCINPPCRLVPCDWCDGRG